MCLSVCVHAVGRALCLASRVSWLVLLCTCLAPPDSCTWADIHSHLCTHTHTDRHTLAFTYTHAHTHSEGCWSTQELQLMTDFWKKEVACAPFSLAAINSFVKLLQLPLLTLKSCVQLIAYHLVRPALYWCIYTHTHTRHTHTNTHTRHTHTNTHTRHTHTNTHTSLQSPPPNLVWTVALCMEIPPGAGDEIPIQLKAGTPGVIYKGKLLLMVCVCCYT